MGVPHRIEYRDTYSIVTDKVPEGRTYCALCSRLRRGHLYRVAREEGCSAIVLGHHQGDIVETFLLNLFFGGKLAAMPPKLLNDEGDVYVLRPLAHVAEADCDRFARAMGYPIIPCDLCGSQDGLQRREVKRMLDDVGEEEPRPPADPVPGAHPGHPQPPPRPGALRLQGPLKLAANTAQMPARP